MSQSSTVSPRPKNEHVNEYSSRRWLVVLLVVLGSIALCAAPLFAAGYLLFQISMVMVYAIAVLGLNLLVGYNGQISIGHGAFFAIGAYVTAILQEHGGWSYLPTIPAAGFVCLMFGILFGLPALRLSGVYLALATFALALAIPQLVRYERLVPWTGGSAGITLPKPPPPLGLPMDSDQWLYYLVLGITIFMFVAAWNLLRGRIGRAIIAIRANPLAASAMGVNTSLFKTVTFGISGLYTGVAGALSSILVQFVSPDTFDLFLSISLLAGVAVGGLGTISGALYGAIFIVFVPNLAGQLSDSAPWAVYGVVLIATMYVMPGGLASLVNRVLPERLETGRPSGAGEREQAASPADIRVGVAEVVANRTQP